MNTQENEQDDALSQVNQTDGMGSDLREQEAARAAEVEGGVNDTSASMDRIRNMSDDDKARFVDDIKTGIDDDALVDLASAGDDSDGALEEARRLEMDAALSEYADSAELIENLAECYVEPLLLAAKLRLERFQEVDDGQFRCVENQTAISRITHALSCLEARTNRRNAQGTLGTREGN